MYQMLQTGEWQIADTRPNLIEAIPSRMHDEKKPGDVLKVAGDPLDDVADPVRYGTLYFHHIGRQTPRDSDERGNLRTRLAEHFDPIAVDEGRGHKRTCRRQDWAGMTAELLGVDRRIPSYVKPFAQPNA